MENFNELLKKYADFIVRVGVNPQPGQTLVIRCSLEAAPLARLSAAPLRLGRGMCRWTGTTMPFPAAAWNWAARRP